MWAVMFISLELRALRTRACQLGNPEASGFKAHSVSVKKASPLLLQALQRNQEADAYSKIGMKQKVSAVLP